MEVRQQAASGKAAAVRAVGSSRITGIHFFLWLDDSTLYDAGVYPLRFLNRWGDAFQSQTNQ